MSFRLTIAAVAIAGALAGPAAAQSWRAASPEIAKLGIVAVACKGEFCIGVACRKGRAELVSMAPGGGPFNGSVTVRLPKISAQLRFVEDPAIMDRLNMLGTRALLPDAIVAAMARESAITISGPTFSDRVTTTFALKDYASHAAALAKACGGGAAGPGTPGKAAE